MQHVAAATAHLPGQFDRPPRNIAEKINSGYKAWEFLLYLYGLAPALLHNILPNPFYLHFCQLVRAMRIIHQYKIKTADILLAHNLLISFARDFEYLYYQRRVDRIHFVRQSIHALLHLAPEVLRIGPPICSSQWTMERTIGNLGQEIRQPSNPYANLSRRGVIRCQVNALAAMFPGQLTGAMRDSQLPRGAVDLGEGYALLRAQDQLRPMRKVEAAALLVYLKNQANVDVSAITSGCDKSDWCPNVARWARLQLPNGQIARSKWKEGLKPLDKVRISRNIKVFRTVTHSDSCINANYELTQFRNNGTSGQQARFGEAQYYFRCKIQDNIFTLAVVSIYSEANSVLLKESAGTVIACQHSGDSSLIVINFASIISVVGMVPHQFLGFDVEEDWRFVVEKPGLDISRLDGACEEDSDNS